MCLPFFRYSKLCFLEWATSIALIIIGSINISKEKDNGLALLLSGLCGFFFFPVINEIFLNFIACLQKVEDREAVKEKFRSMESAMPIVYSAGYNMTAGGLEKCHPFDSTKHKRIWEFLHESGTLVKDKMKFH